MKMRSKTLVAIIAGVAGIGATVQLGLSLAAPAAARPMPAPAFRYFPVGTAITVEIPRIDHVSSARGRNDQIRDWLLYAVINDAGLSPSGTREVLYDLPPLRRDFLRPIANYEFGETRSRPLADGSVIALIPLRDETSTRGLLGRIADDASAASKDRPAKLIPFVYDVSPDFRTARVTRQPDVAAAELFGAGYGYYRGIVKGPNGLRAFLSKTTRITELESVHEGLLISGRLDPKRGSRALTITDVADLWKSEQWVQQQLVETAAFKARWEKVTYRQGDEEALATLKRQYEIEARALFGPSMRPVVIDGSGFSLDPSYDFVRLRSDFGRVRPVLAAGIEQGKLPIEAELLEEVADGIAKEDEIPFLRLLNALRETKDGSLLREIDGAAQRQAARYDGTLRGTEVGMTLFYTDLIAKLWAFGYDSIPTSTIEGFQPALAVPLGTIYDEETKARSSTRLWFGTRASGFQKFEHSLRFGSTSTRVYAASSNPLEPGKEAEPNAWSARFLGWWDDHYEEIAEYEPEYQRLDEIMKWSVALGWLSETNRLGMASWLSDVPESDQQWFPDWVEAHPELRFTKWKEYEIHVTRGMSSRGYTVEQLPLLESPPYDGSYLRGGVSLGSKEAIATRKAFSESLPATVRRADIDYTSAARNEFQTLMKTTYTIADVPAGSRVAGVTAKARPEAKFRADAIELKNEPLDVAFVRSGEHLRATAKLGDTPLAELSIEKQPGRIAVRLRELDGERGSMLLDEFVAVQPKNRLDWLAAHDQVDTAVRVRPSSDHYLVRLNGSDRWMRITPEGPGRIDIDGDAAMRGGKPSRGDGDRWNVAWIDREQVKAALEGIQVVRIAPAPPGSRGVQIELAARPPPGARTVERNGIKGTEAGDSFYVTPSELPSDAPFEPVTMRRIAGTADSVPIDPAGNYRDIGREIVRDPLAFKERVRQGAIEDALQAGNPEQALRHIALAEKKSGATPRTRVWRALARLEQQQLANAVGDLKPLSKMSAASRREALGVAIAVMGREALPPRVRRDAVRVAQFLENCGIEGRAAIPIERRGAFDFEVELTNVKTIAAKKVDGEFVYVKADDPIASRPVWDTGVKAGIDEVMAEPNLVKAYELHDSQIAATQPFAITIVEGAQRTRYELKVDSARTASVRRGGGARYQTAQQRCNEDDEEQHACTGKVYYLTSAQSRPRLIASL